MNTSAAVTIPGQTQTSYYDDVVLQPHESELLELKENVANSSVR